MLYWLLMNSSFSAEPIEKRVSVGTSLFMLFNALPDPEPPAFVQLNVGYRLTEKDVLSLEAITWQVHAPTGIPYGRDYGSPAHRYPGKTRSMGVGVAYQRFLWKGAYAALHTVPFYQRHTDLQGDRLQSGFQLFMTGRLGYHIPLAKKRVFLEPSVACTAWPIRTNLPDSFRAVEDGWPRYFLMEPGFHVGVRL
jgi:hypothetical protein